MAGSIYMLPGSLKSPLKPKLEFWWWTLLRPLLRLSGPMFWAELWHMVRRDHEVTQVWCTTSHLHVGSVLVHIGSVVVCANNQLTLCLDKWLHPAHHWFQPPLSPVVVSLAASTWLSTVGNPTFPPDITSAPTLTFLEPPQNLSLFLTIFFLTVHG